MRRAIALAILVAWTLTPDPAASDQDSREAAFLQLIAIVLDRQKSCGLQPAEAKRILGEGADKVHPPGSDRNLELRNATFAIVDSGMEGGLSRDCQILESAAKTVQAHLDAP